MNIMEQTLRKDLSNVETEDECEYVREGVHELAKYYSSIDVDEWDEIIDDAKSNYSEQDPEYDGWDSEERSYSRGVGSISDYYDLFSSLLLDDMITMCERLAAIRAALIEGEESGVVENYDPQAFVKRLNAEYDAEVKSD